MLIIIKITLHHPDSNNSSLSIQRNKIVTTFITYTFHYSYNNFVSQKQI